MPNLKDLTVDDQSLINKDQSCCSYIRRYDVDVDTRLGGLDLQTEEGTGPTFVAAASNRESPGHLNYVRRRYLAVRHPGNASSKACSFASSSLPRCTWNAGVASRTALMLFKGDQRLAPAMTCYRQAARARVPVHWPPDTRRDAARIQSARWHRARYVYGFR